MVASDGRGRGAQVETIKSVLGNRHTLKEMRDKNWNKVCGARYHANNIWFLLVAFGFCFWYCERAIINSLLISLALYKLSRRVPPLYIYCRHLSTRLYIYIFLFMPPFSVWNEMSSDNWRWLLLSPTPRHK